MGRLGGSSLIGMGHTDIKPPPGRASLGANRAPLEEPTYVIVESRKVSGCRPQTIKSLAGILGT